MYSLRLHWTILQTLVVSTAHANFIDDGSMITLGDGEGLSFLAFDQTGFQFVSDNSKGFWDE